jgi:hypothetical protein
MNEALVLAGAIALASAVAFVVNFAISKGAGKPSDNVLKGIAFVISVGAAYLVAQPAFPEYAGDPLTFGLGLLAFGTLVFKGAQVFYDQVLKKILGAIKLSYA